VIQNEDIAKGITELVSKNGVSKLVMGAAADKHYSRYICSFNKFQKCSAGRTRNV
jgi:hypothetical protein